MILKMSRVLLILWMFVGIPLKCVAQSDDEIEAEAAITDSGTVLTEVNAAVAEVTRVDTLVSDANIAAAPADAPAAGVAKAAALAAIPEVVTAMGRIRSSRHTSDDALARLGKSRQAMTHWETEAGAVNPANTADAAKATTLGGRLDTALADLRAPFAVRGAGVPAAAADGAATTAEGTTAPAALTSVRRKYWFARNVEDAVAVLTEMQTQAETQQALADGGLTTRANDAATAAGTALTAVNNARDNAARDKAAVRTALDSAVAALAQARTVESEALDILSDVDAIDLEIKRIKAADAGTDDTAINTAVAAVKLTISGAAGGAAGINSARVAGAGARDPGAIQKAIEDATAAITEARRVLAILDARDDIARSVEQITAAQTTADSEKLRAQTEHDKTTAMRTEVDAAVAAAQNAQKKASDAEKEAKATDEDRAALKRADEDLRKVMEQEQIVTARIGTAGTENTNAGTAQARVAARLTDANTANTDVMAVGNFASGAAFSAGDADERKLRARERAIAANNDIEAVTTAANAVAAAVMEAQNALNLAKRLGEKIENETPEGRKKADEVADKVNQEDIDARTAEANKKAMEDAMKLAQAAQAAQDAQQQAAKEQADMTNQQQEQQQTQNQLPVDANGAIVNIDHLYDEVYVQPAAGDSDVNCLNNLHRCNEPNIAAQCAGTCTREANGDDHADNCAGMTDLCLEEHYRDLMSTYCVGTCG
ncbi:hypothetical protein Ddc_19645 [Ditylenchus destructor]|nr:hypothetical protein Ddc_19645 [Ditylenchus destructor]